MPSAQTVFETERLLARTWDAADASAYFEICSDPLVMQHIGPGVPWNRGQVDEFIERHQDYQDRFGFCCWALVEKKSNELIGFCGMVPQDDNTFPEIGWRLAQKTWGQGFATEAAQGVVDYATGQLKIKRLFAIAQPGNDASINIMKKLGMQFTENTSKNDQPVVRYDLILD